MADRFPSIEEFTGGETEARGDSGMQLDPATSSNADFLAREKALLGDDADLFASSTNDQPTAASATVQDGDDDDDDEEDLLGGGGDDHAGGNNFDGSALADFQSSFPAIDSGNAQVGPGGTITGNNEPFLGGSTSYPSYGGGVEHEEEADVVREWREKRHQAIQHRDEVSERRKAETIKAAQTAIDDFYENYNTKKEKNIAQTRKEAEEFLASREDTAAGGTSWERIAKLVDLSGKGARGGGPGTGKERFRELLLSLKKDENAPGATGY